MPHAPPIAATTATASTSTNIEDTRQSKAKKVPKPQSQPQ